MELYKYKDISYKYTEKASDIARNLALAGIGILWIIKSNSDIKLTNDLLFTPLILMAISMLVDLVQYVLGGLIWINFYTKHEKTNSSNDDIKSDPWRKNLLYVIYYIKFILMIIAYILIFRALFTIELN